MAAATRYLGGAGSVAIADDLATPIQSVTRANGEIYLQGVENGRMFSILIDEASGDGALAIIADGETAAAKARSRRRTGIPRTWPSRARR